MDISKEHSLLAKYIEIALSGTANKEETGSLESHTTELKEVCTKNDSKSTICGANKSVTTEPVTEVASFGLDIEVAFEKDTPKDTLNNYGHMTNPLEVHPKPPAHKIDRNVNNRRRRTSSFSSLIRQGPPKGCKIQRSVACGPLRGRQHSITPWLNDLEEQIANCRLMIKTGTTDKNKHPDIKYYDNYDCLMNPKEDNRRAFGIRNHKYKQARSKAEYLKDRRIWRTHALDRRREQGRNCRLSRGYKGKYNQSDDIKDMIDLLLNHCRQTRS